MPRQRFTLHNGLVFELKAQKKAAGRTNPPLCFCCQLFVSETVVDNLLQCLGSSILITAVRDNLYRLTFRDTKRQNPEQTFGIYTPRVNLKRYTALKFVCLLD
jgi:hypothetical protein